ncbi:hypothetical protein [Shouchella lonarensis]|uniref:Uncharacterized protein n=1 Tax=Shouchella lonarensis TaxID=1464122 RepID=A0A1G6ILH1_9BACI|nr:hypothetical protein [Shouchella lonarensis]SDC07348.1 hypothetical protein SAMN05421737_105104 [Shouchella lonarensis]
MHPSKIINSVGVEGGSIELVNGGIEIVNSSRVSEALKSCVAENKTRIAKYLRGDYSPEKAKIDYVNDKLVDFMTNYEVDNPKAIDEFLRANEKVIALIIERMQLLYDKGWQPVESTSNYEHDKTDKLAAEIYQRAVDYGNSRKRRAG